MNEDHHSEKDRACDDEPPVTQTVDHGVGEAAGNENKNTRSWFSQLSRKDLIEVCIAGAGVIFAACLVGTAIVQCTVASNQLGEIRKNSERTERAITASNELAMQSAKANLLRESVDRAYAFVAPGNIYHVYPEHIPQSYIVIGNSGHTIAKNVMRSAGIRLLRPPGTDAIEDLGSMRIREEGIRWLALE